MLKFLHQKITTINATKESFSMHVKQKNHEIDGLQIEKIVIVEANEVIYNEYKTNLKLAKHDYVPNSC